MQQDNIDNFEKFFNEKFSQELRQESWNTPDEYVWENIEKQLEKNKRRALIFWIPWALTSFLLAMLLLLLYKYSIKEAEIKSLHEKITEVTQFSSKSEIRILTKENPNSKSDLKTKKLTNPITPITENFGNTLKGSKFKANNLNSLNQNITEGPINYNQNHQKSQLIKKESLTRENGLVVNKNLTIENSAVLKDFNIPYVKNLEFNQVKSTAIEPLSSPVLSTIRNPEISEEGKWYIGAAVGAANWIGRKNGQIMNPLSELILNKRTDISTNFGVRFRRKISSKWAIESGIHFMKRNHSTEYQLNMPYNLETELITPGGATENIFIHSLPSEIGDIETHLIMERRQGSLVQHNESIKVDFSVTNSMQLINIPVQANYYLIKKDQGLYLSAGVLTEFTLKNQFEVVENLSHHSNVREKHAIVSYDSRFVNKLRFYGSAGLGYDYKFGKDLSISGSAIFGKAFTNLYQKNNYTYNYDFININVSMLKVF